MFEMFEHDSDFRLTEKSHKEKKKVREYIYKMKYEPFLQYD